MIAKFNPTGTHMRNGFLKVRIDLYPEPGDKTYSIHHIDEPIRPYTEEEIENEELQDLVPKVKVLNPCLCHFVTIDADTNLNSLIALIGEIFDKDTLTHLDDLLSELDKPENLRKIGQLMRTKIGIGRKVISLTDGLKNELNVRLASVEVRV